MGCRHRVLTSTQTGVKAAISAQIAASSGEADEPQDSDEGDSNEQGLDDVSHDVLRRRVHDLNFRLDSDELPATSSVA